MNQNMKHLRKEYHSTQENVAEKMHTTILIIERLEASGGRSKHPTSLNTLAKDADALGYTLEIKLKPELKR